MILDELDSGVGARLGTPIARLLSQMASAKHAGLTSQIICISHLPQVCVFQLRNFAQYVAASVEISPLWRVTGDVGDAQEADSNQHDVCMMLDLYGIVSQHSDASVWWMTGDVQCAQVAASADHHVVVKKALDGEGRALTRVMILLQEQERLAEVAAMMGVGQQEALQVLQATGAQPGAGHVGGM